MVILGWAKLLEALENLNTLISSSRLTLDKREQVSSVNFVDQ